jgi:hypothetical protein
MNYETAITVQHTDKKSKSDVLFSRKKYQYANAHGAPEAV